MISISISNSNANYKPAETGKPYKIEDKILRFVDAPNELQPCTKHCELNGTKHCGQAPCDGGHFYRFNWLIQSDRRANE